MPGPLDGILVVSMDQAVAAPFATSRLADAGARVIKVERPGGDFARGYDSVAQGLSAYFVWLNRGKESIVLDIKTPEDADTLERMIARADVFVQNLAPGAAGRAGFGSAALRARYPRLITCDISGYGEAGPYSAMKAYDLLIQAETGITSVTGGPEAPGRVGVSICDIGAGMYALIGILEALHERERTGQGRGVKISLFDAMADWMSVPLMYQQFTGTGPPRVGLHHPSVAPYGAYTAGDGGEVVVAIQNEREWRNFCEVVLENAALGEDARFAGNEARVRNRPALDAEIGRVFSGLTRTQLVDRLQRGRIAFGNLNSVADLADHPQLRTQLAATPAGDIETAATPILMDGKAQAPGAVPAIDEHAEALRREFATERRTGTGPD
jgi:crotonobetainyl-CoA:carnitine CoA-transferase CaiB-like acyl-CoA transferase